MTTPAIIKTADLSRMAKIAKRDGVRVEVEVDGKIFRVTPDIPANPKLSKVELTDDFTSLADWQEWRDQERAREAQRHS